MRALRPKRYNGDSMLKSKQIWKQTLFELESDLPSLKREFSKTPRDGRYKLRALPAHLSEYKTDNKVISLSQAQKQA